MSIMSSHVDESMERPPGRRYTFQYSDFGGTIVEDDGTAMVLPEVASPSLRGRLNEGTLHRQSIRAEEEEDEEVIAVRIDRPVGKLVEQVRQQGTWAQQYVDSDRLRGAVTTSEDAFTPFEQELEKEINLLRSSPKEYAQLVEREAVLAAPYVVEEDVYFDSEEAATIDVSWYGVPVANYSEEEQSPEKNESARSGGSRHGSTSSNNSHRASSKGRPNSKATSARAQSSRTAATEEGSHTSRVGGGTIILPDLSVLLTPSTVKEMGISGVNLAQLRTHVTAQQRYREVLESTMHTLRDHWRQACQTQKQSWQAIDEKNAKKKKTSQKKNNSQGRSLTPTAESRDSLQSQREAATARLNAVYKEHLLLLNGMRMKVVDACRRAIAGANLILETIRALRQVQPCGALRPCRGLKIAARDTVNDFHQMVSPLQSHLVQAKRLLFLSDTLPSDYIRTQPEGRREEEAAAHDSEENDGEEEEENTTNNNTVSNVLNLLDTPEELDQRLPATCYLREELEAIALVGRRACDRYGFVAREVRGIQLYWPADAMSATPRSVVIDFIMGVSVPEFVLGEHAFPSAKPISEEVTTPDDAEGEQSIREERHNMFALMNQIQQELASGENDGDHTSDTAKNFLTSFYWKGSAHPTTPGAAAHLKEHVLRSTTSLQRRSAEAARRLGSLLWSDASQVGCSWQQVREHRVVPQYAHEGVPLSNRDTKHETKDSTFTTDKPMIAAATILLGCGYETIESVSQRENLSVDETRRLVLSDQGEEAFDADSNNRTNSSHNASVRKAVVDLHSKCGVHLLQPQTHPIWITDPTQKPVLTLALSTGGNNTGGNGNSYTFMSSSGPAKTSRTYIGAALTGLDPPEPIPPAPVLSRELLLQRSLVNPQVFLVLIDTQSVCARYDNKPVLVHLYERQVFDGDDDDEEEDSNETYNDYSAHGGFEHIGFIRVMPLPQSSGSAIRAVSTLRHAAAQQHQHTANLANSTDKLTGTVTHGVTPLVDYTTGLKLPSATDEFALTAMNHSTTSYNNNNSNSNNNSNMTNGETTTAARLSGWPITTNYFTEREGVIRSPLRACLNSAMGTIHFQVRFAAKTRMSSYHGNIASIRKILRKLKKQEEEDAIKLEEMRQLKQEQLEEQQRSKSQSPMDVPEQDTTTPSEASTTKRKAKSNAGKKSTMEEGRSTMASSFATNVMSPSQYREVFTLPVPEIVAYLQSVGCAPHEGSYTVQEIDTQSFYLLPVEDHEKAAQILKNDAKKAKTHLEEFIVPKAEKEKERLEKECGKRKGKELTRAKADLDEMTELLEEVTHEASALATLATKANQEASRRSRDCVLRQARIKDLEKQLALLLEKESAELDNNHNHNEGAFSSDVKTSKVQLWFMSPFTAGVNQLRVAEGGPDSNNLLTLEAVFSNDEGTLYEREVSVPGDFEGRAVLLVDDHEVATWFVERRH